MSPLGKVLLLVAAAVIAYLWWLRNRIHEQERDKRLGLGLSEREQRAQAIRDARIELARRRRQELADEEIRRRENET